MIVRFIGSEFDYLRTDYCVVYNSVTKEFGHIEFGPKGRTIFSHINGWRPESFRACSPEGHIVLWDGTHRTIDYTALQRCKCEVVQ